MAGLQTLMQQGQMPGEAGMFSALPAQQGRNPVAFTTSLKQIPPEELIRIYNDPDDIRPKWAVASAYADAMKAKALKQGVQGQQAMAQNVAEQQKPPVADELMTRMAASGGEMRSYADGGAIRFQLGGDAFVPPDLIINPDYDKDGNPRSATERDSIIRQNAERIRAYKEAQANKDKGFFERLSPNEPLRQVYEYFQKPSQERKPMLDAVGDFLTEQFKTVPTTKTDKGAPAVAPAQGRVRKDEAAVTADKSERPGGAPRAEPSPQAATADRPNAGLGALDVGDIGGFVRRLETASELTDQALREKAKVTPEMQALRERMAQSRARQLEQSEADIGKIREEGVRQLQGRLDAARRPLIEDPEALLAIAGSINTERGKVFGSAAEAASKVLAERRARGEKAEEGITALNEKVRQLNALYQEARAIEDQRQYAILQNDVEGQRNAEIEAAKNRQKMRETQASLTANLVEAAAKGRGAMIAAQHATIADQTNQYTKLQLAIQQKEALEQKLRKANDDKYSTIYSMAALPGAKDDVKKQADDARRELQGLLAQLDKNFDPGINLLRRQVGLPAISEQTPNKGDGFGTMTVKPTKTP